MKYFVSHTPPTKKVVADRRVAEVSAFLRPQLQDSTVSGPGYPEPGAEVVGVLQPPVLIGPRLPARHPVDGKKSGAV